MPEFTFTEAFRLEMPGQKVKVSVTHETVTRKEF